MNNKTYSLKTLKTCIALAKEEVKNISHRPKESWLEFNVKRIEIYQTGIFLRGEYKNEDEERLLKRVEWHPRIEASHKEIISFLNEHHKKGLILSPSEVLNSII